MQSRRRVMKEFRWALYKLEQPTYLLSPRKAQLRPMCFLEHNTVVRQYSYDPMQSVEIICFPLVLIVAFGENLPQTETQAIYRGAWIVTVHSTLSSISIQTHDSSIQSSQAVSHPRTIQATCCSTTGFERELVFPKWHSQWQQQLELTNRTCRQLCRPPSSHS